MDRPPRIHVLAAHALPLVRAGVAAALGPQPDIELHLIDPIDVSIDGPVDGPIDAHPALALGHDDANTKAVQVLVLDYAAGLRWAQWRREHADRMRWRSEVMVLTPQAGEWEIRQAIRHGVLGLHLLDTPLERLATGVRLLAAGRRSFDDSVAARLADCLAQPTLTVRESDVLSLLAAGACNKDIARRLGIALGTAKTHVRALLDKLHVESRTQAVVVARERGLVGSGTC